jgi:hypothetical protein
MAVQRMSVRARAAKGATLGGCILVAGLFVASAYYVLIWQSADLKHLIVVRKGAVCYKWEGPYIGDAPKGLYVTMYEHPHTGGWHYERFPSTFSYTTWLPHTGTDGQDSAYWRGIVLPLWIPFLPLTGVTLWLWWRYRPVLVGVCANCRYDLTGNTSGRCPECGTEVAAGPTNRVSQQANPSTAEAPLQ